MLLCPLPARFGAGPHAEENGATFNAQSELDTQIRDIRHLRLSGESLPSSCRNCGSRTCPRCFVLTCSAEELHSKGINMRHLGLLRQHVLRRVHGSCRSCFPRVRPQRIRSFLWLCRVCRSRRGCFAVGGDGGAHSQESAAPEVRRVVWFCGPSSVFASNGRWLGLQVTRRVAARLPHRRSRGDERQRCGSWRWQRGGQAQEHVLKEAGELCCAFALPSTPLNHAVLCCAVSRR